MTVIPQGSPASSTDSTSYIVVSKDEEPPFGRGTKASLQLGNGDVFHGYSFFEKADQRINNWAQNGDQMG